ncbi:MAG: pectinesterase family protein [Candidatus Azobacteroides sp.]|nr:pectinesterase family protein [Candidatus Azobacteroides sp.]
MRKLFTFFSLFLVIGLQMKAQDPASVVWPLTSSTQTAATLSGQLEEPEIKLSGISVNKYNAESGKEFVVYQLITGGSTIWNTVEDPDIYIEYSVTAKAGNIFTADFLSFGVYGMGGTHMRANFYYSTDPSFARRTKIAYKEDESLVRDTDPEGGIEIASLAIDETIEAGQRIYFRIYPYYRDENTTGKYICVKNVTFSGTTIATAVEASVKWAFKNDVKPTISGGLLAEDMSFGSGMQVYDYTTSVATFEGESLPGGSAGPPSSTSCNWENSNVPEKDMYVQYEVSPKTGATFTITTVSMRLSAFSTDKMEAAVYYSKNADFSARTELKAGTLIPHNELEKWDFTLNEEITSDEVFYVRVYPYLPGGGTWKLLNIRDVVISGTTFGATVDLPEISTVSAASYISTTTALAGGTVLNDGGAAITARGMVWSTTQNPTIDDAKSIDGAGAGIFESTLSGLSAGTVYYARAYATNTAGTAYGDQISFTTLASLVVPTVSTTGSSNVLNTSMTVSGNVTAWGGTDVTERGVVWGVNSNPTIDDNKEVAGSGLGTFQAAISGLTPETTYYVRAYATNSTGTAYGTELAVTTLATQPDVTKIVDINGSGDYTSISDAFADVPVSYTGRWIIRVKAGEYYERPTLESGKVNVYLIGENAETTIITHDTYAGQDKGDGTTWGTSNSQTMAIIADDFMAVNLTIANTFVNSEEVKQSGMNDTQAVALKTQGDRQSFYNCRIVGYQDTYLGNSVGRAYFKNCYIEGNVDFIFGRQTVVFDQCTTYVNRNGSVITAPATQASTKFGMVFLDCNLTSPSTDYIDFDGKNFDYFHYGRPWQSQPKAAFIRCATPATLNEKGWTTMNGGLNPVFVEYGCTGEGATPERLAQRTNEGTVISEAEAAAYTVENIFKKDTDPSFTADWMPKDAPDEDLVSSLSLPSETKTARSFCTPNPVEDVATIYYTLAKNSQVTINLYDVNGKLIHMLENGKYDAGNYSIQWNASSLVAGIYFYSLQTDYGKEVGKIIRK